MHSPSCNMSEMPKYKPEILASLGVGTFSTFISTSFIKSFMILQEFKITYYVELVESTTEIEWISGGSIHKFPIYVYLCGIENRFLENFVRIGCIKHIVSVPFKPRSNSSFDHDRALQRRT